jgi:hypothetical protein
MKGFHEGENLSKLKQLLIEVQSWLFDNRKPNSFFNWSRNKKFFWSPDTPVFFLQYNLVQLRINRVIDQLLKFAAQFFERIFPDIFQPTVKYNTSGSRHR